MTVNCLNSMKRGFVTILHKLTDLKMIDKSDNVYNPSTIIAPGREVERDYPTGVWSGEDEIAARRVEMIPNPAYGTVTCGEKHV